jgi:hypothetical protein
MMLMRFNYSIKNARFDNFKKLIKEMLINKTENNLIIEFKWGWYLYVLHLALEVFLGLILLAYLGFAKNTNSYDHLFSSETTLIIGTIYLVLFTVCVFKCLKEKKANKGFKLIQWLAIGFKVSICCFMYSTLLSAGTGSYIQPISEIQIEKLNEGELKPPGSNIWKSFGIFINSCLKLKSNN